MNNIKLYGAGWCEDTQRTRHHLDSLGVPYDYIDVDTDKAAEFWIAKQNNGKRQTPTLDMNGKVLIEPTNPELDEALKSEGIVQRRVTTGATRDT